MHDDLKHANIFCSGWCLFSSSPYYEFGTPKETAIKMIPYKEAMDQGWTQTTDKLFSPTGEVAFLCPECTKRYAREINGRIDAIFKWILEFNPDNPERDKRLFFNAYDELKNLTTDNKLLDKFWFLSGSGKTEQDWENLKSAINQSKGIA